MNTDVKVLDQNPVSAPVSGGIVQPQASSLNKEVPHVTSLPELKPAGLEVKHNIDQELKETGIEEKNDMPDLTTEHKEVGIKYAGATIPISSSSSDKIELPMSEEEIKNQLKTGQDDDSRKGLAKILDKVTKAIRMLGF